MSQTAQQASLDATTEPAITSDTGRASQQAVSTTTASTQRIFRVYKPLGGKASAGKKARMALGARAKKGGFFADRFERYVPLSFILNLHSSRASLL
jgi:hypothetical protein